VNLNRPGFRKIGQTLIPWGYLEGVRLLAGGGFSWERSPACWLLIGGAMILGWAQPPRLGGKKKGAAAWVRPGLTVLTGAAAWVTGRTESFYWAGLTLVLFYGLLAGWEKGLFPGRTAWRKWGTRLVLSLLGGMLPVLYNQVEIRFSEEEFFALLQVLVLSGFTLILILSAGTEKSSEPGFSFSGGGGGPRWGGRMGVSLLVVGVLFLALRAYQQSFYSPQAPSFPGISSAQPFICGSVRPNPQSFDGPEVFQQMVDRVAANPRKEIPEYGLLGLATGRPEWLQAFKERLLSEANKAYFVRSAQSVKFIQYEAALRVYYYYLMKQRFPRLFSSPEDLEIRRWLAAVNRRALTVEWVDWLYALAFSRRPEGPYENQENGAGLLALLEFSGLADPSCSGLNRKYLGRTVRGWKARFRNTDDALVYQPEWITNAFFQSHLTGWGSKENQKRSFEWLLLQALPDGSWLGYNHPGREPFAGIFCLGARLVNDERFLWIAGNSLRHLQSQGEPLAAQPGAETPLTGTGTSPREGSCLLYGDSGLPNQPGPLAPDKVVFRDGWLRDSKYLLLNLRFSGWHRYKASNTVTLLHQQRPVVVEDTFRRASGWLPEGRSLFRDKRIPRENLNGLVVKRVGLDDWLFRLTGSGSPWAQDPPAYARVEEFETGARLDTCTASLQDWHGWRHRRKVLFYRDGPVVIADQVRGPADQEGALRWHILKEYGVQRRVVAAGENQSIPPVVLWVVEPDENPGKLQKAPGPQDLQVVSEKTGGGKLEMVTVFLGQGWEKARVTTTLKDETLLLRIEKKGKTLTVPLSRDYY
jgi:hypothetical protein